jgi:outer membrane immunogenic protein
MNKNTILAIAIIASGVPAMAQVQVGVKGGINIATVKYKKIGENTASVGYNAGLLARIRVTDGFFIQPEAQYSLKGYRYNTNSSSGTGTTRLNYFTVPLLAGFNISDKFQGLIGPEFGYLISANSVFAGNKTKINDLFEHFDWGLDLGATYKITNTLGVEARYNFGFRGLIKGIVLEENGGLATSTKDGANRVFQAGLYYLFVK